MSTLQIAIILAFTMIGSIAVIACAALAGWRGWLRLKLHEFEAGQPHGPGTAMQRIELADLRERVRRLEAIAAGVDP